ncbi:MAG: rhodanese-like domain-containing protein [Sphingomonadales bacterium]|nr:rhodanese-like domain-containing protein [Sphingomonadales bacterium]
MFGLGKAKHQEIRASELAELLGQDAAVVVDVREVDEFSAGHIPGSVNMPLSTFQASKLPDPGKKRLVLTCLGGKRSGMALDKCRAVEALANTHLAGGFSAWASAGLPVER